MQDGREGETHRSLELWLIHPPTSRYTCRCLPASLCSRPSILGKRRLKEELAILKVSSKQEELASGGGDPQTLHFMPSEQGRGRGTCGLGLVSQVDVIGGCFGYSLTGERVEKTWAWFHGGVG